jgi:hypothetical protein
MHALAFDAPWRECRFACSATSSSRFTQPNYWRDPNSDNAFQIQVEMPQNRMQSVDSVGELPIMLDGHRDTELTNRADEAGNDAGAD